MLNYQRNYTIFMKKPCKLKENYYKARLEYLKIYKYKTEQLIIGKVQYVLIKNILLYTNGVISKF